MSTQVDLENSEGGIQSERWQSKIRTLKDGIAHIYKTKEFADVHFTVGSKTFKAHRLILAARSPVFAKMLLSKTANPSISNIEFCDVSEDGFDILLRYIYANELSDLPKNQIIDAYRAASRFGQKGLFKWCEDSINQWEITSNNVCELLNQVSDVHSMRDRCLEFVQDNAGSVLASDGLLEASLDTISIVLDGGSLSPIPPMFLVRNVLRWAANQFPKQTNYTLVRELLLQSSRPLLGRIGIEKLSFDELATIIAEYNELLTPVEVTQFFLNTHKPGSMPLPDWILKEPSMQYTSFTNANLMD